MSVPLIRFANDSLLFAEIVDPTRPPRGMRSALRLGTFLGACGGFLLAYQRSSCECCMRCKKKQSDPTDTRTSFSSTVGMEGELNRGITSRGAGWLGTWLRCKQVRPGPVHARRCTPQLGLHTAEVWCVLQKCSGIHRAALITRLPLHSYAALVQLCLASFPRKRRGWRVVR